MITHIPKVTGRLREWTQQLADDPSVIVQRCYALLPELDESYARLPQAYRQDFLDFMSFSGRLWFNSLLSGEFPSPAEIEVVSNTGRRRVHQGISLVGLLRGMRVGSLQIWSELLEFAKHDGEAQQELLFSISRYLLEYFDVMSQTMAQGYLDEQYERQRWRDALRHQLTTTVLHCPEDAQGFNRAAESLGLDPTLPRVALALELPLGESLPSKLESEFDRMALTAGRHLKVSAGDLVRAFHRGRLIFWIPCTRGDTIVSAEEATADGIASWLKSGAPVEAAGIGLMNQGAAGWAMSADEAMKALDAGRRADPGRRLHRYSDIAVNESVRRTDNVLRYLSSLLERLANEPELIATLQSYFEHHQRRKVVADALGIHPNTLSHRLQRVESLLGANLEDAAWVSRLHIALRLRHAADNS